LKRFLAKECAYSNFQEDYVLVDEFERKYDEFCTENSVP